MNITHSLSRALPEAEEPKEEFKKILDPIPTPKMQMHTNENEADKENAVTTSLSPNSEGGYLLYCPHRKQKPQLPLQCWIREGDWCGERKGRASIASACVGILKAHLDAYLFATKARLRRQLVLPPRWQGGVATSPLERYIGPVKMELDGPVVATAKLAATDSSSSSPKVPLLGGGCEK
ncbi:hypothetical protein BT69DRAFT_1333382 [Atractiella rhizophila]|nr:hypothetical protein BT69DRAFT_1333382 [Atractiella rhizophila]